MKRLSLGGLLFVALHMPAYAVGTIGWDAEAGFSQYKFEDTLNSKVWIDNSAIQAEVGASYAFDKLVTRLSLAYGTSMGDAEFSQNTITALALYPIKDFTLQGGYEIRNTAITKFGNGADTEVDINSSGFVLGASYRIPKSRFVASLTVSPLDADIDNNTIGASTSESTTATAARLSYSHKTYKFSVVFASYDYDTVAETVMQAKVLHAF